MNKTKLKRTPVFKILKMKKKKKILQHADPPLHLKDKIGFPPNFNKLK